MQLKNLNRMFKINGCNYILKSAVTVLELMDYLGFNKNVIVIDYNGTILEKKNWERTILYTGDSLEILSIAGGG